MIDAMPLRLLLVEDDGAAARLVRDFLSAAAQPVTVTHVTRLTAAVAHVVADAARPDVVLLDLILPDARGLHALSVLRAAAPHLPIVILSANDDETLAMQGVQEGAQDYLIKGRVAPDTLARALRYAVERQRGRDRLTYLAFHDALTDLPNRTLFDDRMRLALADAQRRRRPLAVLFLDLDGFKGVNDALGHEAGDLLLREAAARLIGCTRGSDTVARLAGDEFTVLLPDADAATAEAVAAKIVDIVGSPYTLDGRAARVTVSAGIALYPDHGRSAPAIISAADMAMYAAKRRGKNGYAFGQPHTAPSIIDLDIMDPDDIETRGHSS